MAANDVFFDTNILLYAFLDFQDAHKHTIATDLFSQFPGAISTQVVNELCSNILKKTNASEDTVEKIIRGLYQKYLATSLTELIIIKASTLRSRYKFSFWDSMIVASALESTATILYSEDMQHNLIVEDQLTIINPFK